jgi:phosphohistidine phosphatase
MEFSMRRLILFRHSKAEESEPGKNDRDRTLTGRGRDDASAIGTYLARHELTPDFALVSPAARTRETWTLAAAALARETDRKVPVTFDDRLYASGPGTILGVLAETSPELTSVIVVGHNPEIQALATGLIGTGDIEPRQKLLDKFPTSGLAVIDFAATEWKTLKRSAGRLHLFVNPRLISAATE